MLRTILFAFALISSAAAFQAPSKDDKQPPPATIKVQLDKPEPSIPVKLVFPPIEFHFCVKSVLTDTDFYHRTGKDCRPHYEGIDTANVEQIVGAFAKDTEYTVTAPDKGHILVFCNAKSCPVQQSRDMRETILRLAKPSPLGFLDVDAPPGVTAKDLAAAVARMSKGKVTGRVLDSGKVRLETDANLDRPSVDGLLSQIRISTPASLAALSPLPEPVRGERIALPAFCIAKSLSGPDPAAPDAKGNCPAATSQAPGSNAAAIAAALSTDKIKVAADGPSAVVVSCGESKCDSDALDLIGSSLAAMARPSPSRIEDIPVLSQTAAASAAKIAKWSSGLVSADPLSDDSIRLKSDVSIPRADIDTWRQRLLDDGFGAISTVPVKPLFYRDAVDVVSSLAGAPPAAALLAPGTSAPNTSGGSSSAPAAPAAVAAPAAAPAAAPPAAGAGTSAFGLTPVDNSIVFTAGPPASDADRSRLLALIDLPRPEVLMNMWSLQASSPEGLDLALQSKIIRSTVALHNDALQNSIEYGWAYLSRQMHNNDYFNPEFYNYLTQRFVADTPACLANPKDATCISDADRQKYRLCPAGQYCLGYPDVFKPLKPTLTNILVGLMAARDPFDAVFTTLACMEGKFDNEQVRKKCFPERDAIQKLLGNSQDPTVVAACLRSRTTAALAVEQGTSRESLKKAAAARGATDKALEEHPARYLSAALPEASCEDLDRAALMAQRACGVTLSLPLSCFTEQAAKSFVPYHAFSTFTTEQLRPLTRVDIAGIKSELGAQQAFSTSPIGLLRAATANFLFNYKMAQEFPREFSPYNLSHSAQDLNAEFNPLVVAFNQDVAAFSRALMDQVQDDFQGERWKGRNKTFLADGLVTVRGLSGLESLVDTDTQSSFSAPQYQTPASALANLANLAGGAPASSNASTTTSSTTTVSGDTTTSTSTTAPTPQPAPPPPSSNLTSLLPSFLSRASLPAALAAAILPTGAQVQIGRQLTVDITPHSLPGASSAELDVKLWAQEDSPPALYKDGGANPQIDPISRVARHNVFTRVRVESVKLFEISSFSAMLQRPRKKVPILPVPFLEIPLLNDFLGLPLPGAKVYHRSTAIVSAIVVPTASDLAFGIDFLRDRAAVADKTYRNITSLSQLPRPERGLYEFNQAKARCLATSDGCGLKFQDLAPDR